MKKTILTILICVLMAAGCASPSYRQVFKEKPSANSRVFNVSRDLLYAAAAKVLCERNFIIENEDKDKGFMLGKRSFQRGRKTFVLLMQGKIVSDGPDRSTMYVNAIETTETYYVADHTRFFLFLIPLPGGGGKDVSTVKEAEKTVQDKRFYKDFFAEVDKKIKDEQAYLAVCAREAAAKEAAAKDAAAKETAEASATAKAAESAPQPEAPVQTDSNITVSNATGP
jgi:hypothetical protein